MLLKIKTSKIEFHLEGEELKLANYVDNKEKAFLQFVKEAIQSVADETVKIKNGKPSCDNPKP